ncbi:MAG: NADH-quinone oxidoreductase subunit L [bacterium]|nr:NADH-quinone oxidoreductase subunit L [bacterium]MCP4964353.1 NADH-quinone oxidoreductase subunit L [bacterium]
MVDYLWLIVLVPLLSAAILLFFGKRIGDNLAGPMASAAVLFSFVYAALASADFITGAAEHGEVVMVWSWIPGLGLDAAYLWDPLSAMITAVVTGVGLLIHIFAMGYMAGDPRIPRFFGYLNLFIASMLILELAANFGVMFVGWELVGLSSYLLISFWFEKPSAAAAGKKAFIVNRIGDFGFMIALMLIFANFGTLDFEHVFEVAPVVLSASAATTIALMLFVGATGKSAQIPLYVWLLDAMEGPTPVSALIHAATMVTAGVFMIARAAPLFELSELAMGVVATVGAITALFAGTAAIAQRDIKRVLAYSTVSQLGFMVLAVGLGAYVAGMFHILTHAFFKALLFLGAGSVIHAMAGEQDMNKMGGLRRVMPVTFWTMTVASLALAGIVPFSGFWSKDEILAAAFVHGDYAMALWVIGLIAALFTAFYITRLMMMTFFGSPRWDESTHPHESPTVMTAPLIVLAVGAFATGFVNLPWSPWLEHFLESAFEGVEHAELPATYLGLATLASIASLLAMVGIFYAYRRYHRDELPDESQGVWKTLLNGYYVDELYGRTIVMPGKAASQALADFDANAVDGAVDGVGGSVKRLAEKAKPLQSGLVRSYGVWILGGAVAVVLIILVRGAL